MKTIFNGNNILLKWFFTDAITGTDFVFDNADTKVTLYSCNYKKELNHSIDGNIIQSTIPSYLPVGVYTLECTYWVGIGAKRANVVIHEAFQVTRNTGALIEPELEFYSVAMPIFTSKIATVEYITEERYKELETSQSLGKRTLYVVTTGSGVETMHLYNKPLGGSGYPADEEDITLAEKTEEVENEYGDTVEKTTKVYKFKDRDTAKGKGYIILRTEKPLAEQMVQENTIYEIRYDFDLNGETLEVPVNCVLDFKGGGFSNGTILGSNTTIKAEKPFVIFDNVNITGTFDVDYIYDKWFSYVEGGDSTAMFKNIIAMSNPDMRNKIVIDRNTTYYVSAYQNLERIISPTNNTDLVINSNIQLMTNNFTHYGIIGLIGTENISISGSGHIIGDVETHTGTTGQWGFGIEIRGAKNINISGITLEKCWGDGISTDEGSGIPENIIIDNIVCDNNRRQGISIVLGRNIVVKNSILQNTGQIKYTAPGCGIDVEPTKLDGTNPAESILIENCRFYNNKGGSLTLTRYLQSTDNVIVSNCYGNGNLIISGVYNTSIINCTFPNYSAMGDNYNLNHINCNYYNGKHTYNYLAPTYNNLIGCKFNIEDVGYTITQSIPEINAGEAFKIFNVWNTPGMIKITVVGSNRWIGQRIQEVVYGNQSGKWIRYSNRVLGMNTFEWSWVRQILCFSASSDADGHIYARFFNENDYNIYYTFKIEYLGIPEYDIPYYINPVKIISRSDIPTDVSFKQFYDNPMYVGTVELGYMSPQNGACIFDSTRGKPIWFHNGKWVDATGADVNAAASE